MTSGGGMGGEVDTLYTDVVARLDQKSFRQIESEVEQAGERAGKKGGGRLSEAFGGLIGGLPGLAATAAAAVGTALVAGAAAAVDIASQARQGLRDMQSELGVTAEEAAKLGEQAKQVFAGNWGDSLSEAQDMVVEVRKQMRGLADDDLGAATSAAAALADTFGTDVGEQAQAADTLMKNFGLTSQQAFDFLAKGFQDGLNNSGDFLDTIGEYSTQFKNGGATAEQFFSTLKSGQQGGMLGTDKAADAFKEFVVRIQDGSKTTSDGLKQIGINSDELARRMASGQVTAADAFNLVLTKLRQTKDSNTQMQAGVALLGTQFEDLGRSGALALNTTAVKMKDLQGATDQVNQRYNSLGQLMQGAWRQVLLGLEPVGRMLLDLANDAMPAVKSALGQVGPVMTQVVRFLVDGFRQGRQIVGEFAPAVQQAFGTFRSVVGMVLPYVMQAFSDLKPVVAALGPLFRSAFALVAQVWQTVLQPAIRDILPVVSSVFGGVAAAVRGAIGIVTGVINAVVALLRGDLPGAVRALEGAFEAGVQGAVGAMKGLLGGVLNVVRAVAPQMAGAAADIIAGLVRGIENGAGAVVTAARNLAGNVVAGIKSKLRIQSPSKETYILGEHAVEGFADGITKTTPQVQRATAGLTTAVLSETEKARQALEKSISWDAWVQGLRSATSAQLERAQALARSSGDAERYGAITSELARRHDAATAATDRATEAARREREELSNNRAQIARGEAMERYVQGLRSATGAQLDHALSVARAAGDIEHYNAIKSEQQRREDAAGAATRRSTDAAHQQAEQLAANRRQIEDGLKFEEYVSGLGTYTDAQLAAAHSNALAAGDGQKFNAVLAEQRRRAEETAQAVSDLADAQIAAANSRYADTQGATDSAYRLSYGAGDEGLIRSLAAITGRTIAQVREDVEGALADARHWNSEAATIIERVWSDALAHRREVGAAERAEAEATAKADQDAYASTQQFILDTLGGRTDEGLLRLYDEAHARRDTELMNAVTAEIARRAQDLNARILASDVETSRARTQAIAELYRADQEAADDAAITVGTLKGQIAELIAQGRDPTKSGFTDWLNELIQKGGQAGDAAAYVKKNIEDLIVQAQFLNLPRDGEITDVAPARPTVAPEKPTASPALRGDRGLPATTPSEGTGALDSDKRQWQATVEAKEAMDAYRLSLTLKSDAELESAKATEFAAGHQQQYNLIVEETERRAKIAADSTQLITDAEGELASLVTGESLPAWETRARALEQQAVLDVDNADRLLQLADAIRVAGAASDAAKEKLNVTVKIGGLDTGLKALDLYKTALQGVGDVIQGVFSDLVAGTDTGVQGILANMAKMALGIVKSVAVSIAAYQAQAIALALISGASFNFVQAGLALAAAAAVAGIAAGLEARLGQQQQRQAQATSSSSPGGTSSSAGAGSSGSSTAQSSITIPTSQVTVMAAPEWEARFGGHVDRFGRYVEQLVTQGVLVRADVRATAPSRGLSAFDLSTP